MGADLEGLIGRTVCGGPFMSLDIDQHVSTLNAVAMNRYSFAGFVSSAIEKKMQWL
jgi:hypothetical protein